MTSPKIAIPGPLHGTIQDGAEILAITSARPAPNMRFKKVEISLIIALEHGKRSPSDPDGMGRNDVMNVLRLLKDEVRTVVL